MTLVILALLRRGARPGNHGFGAREERRRRRGRDADGKPRPLKPEGALMQSASPEGGRVGGSEWMEGGMSGRVSALQEILR